MFGLVFWSLVAGPCLVLVSWNLLVLTPQVLNLKRHRIYSRRSATIGSNLLAFHAG